MGKVFNAVYDQFMSQRPYTKYARCYLQACEAKTTDRILEAGCGSGLFLMALNRLGYNPEGLDFDEAMLELAQKRVENKLYHGDIREFCSEEKWDVIFLPLDVLNYFSRSGMKKAFKNLARNLNPHGVIVFDVHTKAHLKKVHGAQSRERLSDAQNIWRSRGRGEYIHYYITCSKQGYHESYKLEQRVHSPREILRAAAYAGFRKKQRCRAWDLGRIDRRTTRQLFVLQKV